MRGVQNAGAAEQMDVKEEGAVKELRPGPSNSIRLETSASLRYEIMGGDDDEWLCGKAEP